MMNYFYVITTLAFVSLTLPLATQAATVTSKQSGLWSEATTWKNHTIPNQGDSVEIADGTTVTYDVVSDDLIDQLTVNGTLRFSPTTNTRLTVNAVTVYGQWRMGTKQQPIPQDITAEVFLTGSDESIGVYSGTFSVFGAGHDLTWTNLKQTAEKNADHIYLQEAVDWQVGDSIVIASTSYEADEAETKTIIAISDNKKELTLNSGLQYTHDGADYEFAEVGLLTHNVIFSGDSASDAGHIFFTEAAHAQIRGATFDTLGKKNTVGQYPVHFHMMADGEDSFIKQSAIINSANRCVTIHGTNNVLVRDNVAYHTKGHCYFMEDGVEEDNNFIHNLGIDTLPSNTIDSDAKPATFWITNPHNTFKNNSAAGSDSFGFWFFLLEEPTGMSAEHAGHIMPNQRTLKDFKNNTTHSNGRHGFTIDGHNFGEVSYEPTKTANFKGTLSYKNKSNGMWARGKKLTVTRATLVDNQIGLTFAGQDTLLNKSVVVGQSSSTSAPLDKPVLAGVDFYDGIMAVTNTTFKNFTSSKQHVQAAISMKAENIFALSPDNYLKNITYKNANKFYLNDASDNGEIFAVINDKDSNTTILPKLAFHDNERCVKKSDWNAYKCNAIDYGRLVVTDQDNNHAKKITITRLDSNRSLSLKAQGKAANGEFLMNVPVQTSYKLSLKNTDRLSLQFDQAEKAIEVQLPYSKAPDHITRNGKNYTDWTYNEHKNLVSLTLEPDDQYVIVR